MARNFCHNDLFTKSIYVDLKATIVTIVDWEYSAKACWSNDLGKLCFNLAPEVANLLTKYYYCEISGARDTQMPEKMKQEIQLNSFLHKFLKVAWGISYEDLHDSQKAIDALYLEKEGFSGELDRLHKAATSSNPIVSLVRSHPYLTAGLFAVAAGTTCAYFGISNQATESISSNTFS